MTYDFQQLKRLSIYATVVEQGSFAGAAKLLGMSRPAVSEQVALLEKQLNVRLLHRTTRKLSLTLDGENLYPHAANINAAYMQAADALDSSELSGRVRLTTTVDFAIEWLTPKLAAFQALYPDIYIDVISGDDKTDLVADQIDLAIRIGVTTDDSLIARPLFKEKLQVYASPSYLKEYGEPNTLVEAEAHRWVLLPQLFSDDNVTLWRDNQQAQITPTQFWRSSSPAVMMAQVQAGLGLGIAFPFIVEKLVKQGRLIKVLPDWHSVEMTFSLLYASRRQMPQRVQVLRDFLLA